MNFTERLISWYRLNKRELPFRSQSDPYNVWVSEIMAQQTQIATMLPYYERWIKRFPDVQSLASGKLEEVLKLWEGLGYYRRARNLFLGAQYVVEHFDGVIPQSKKELMLIPGIGDYTASAIASIAFHLPEIVIDGNVKRVMARFLNYTDNVNTAKAHKTFETFLKEELLLNKADPNEFNQAMMELGALVCTPSNITCEGCPFKELCACYRGEVTGVVPFIPKTKRVPVYDKTVFVSITNDKLFITDHNDDGLMEGLYRLPYVDGHTVATPDMKLIHKFSHLTWNIHVHLIDDPILFEHKLYFVPIEDIENHHPLVGAHRKILEKLGVLTKIKDKIN